MSGQKLVDVLRRDVRHALRDCRLNRSYDRMRRERPAEYAASRGYTYHPWEALAERQRDLVVLRRQLRDARRGADA